MLKQLAVILTLMALGAAVAAVAAESPGTAVPATGPSHSAGAAAPGGPAPVLYLDIVGTYMDGHWDTLEKTLKDKASEIQAFSRQETADINTIRTALKDGRPDWWMKTKAGAKVQIRPMIWGRAAPMNFDPATKGGVDTTITKGVITTSVGWPTADMDSAAPTDHGFTRGDLASYTIFSNLGNAEAAGPLPPPSRDTAIPLERYLAFRSELTGIVYGTPGARRYGIWQCLAGYNEDVHGQTKMAPRAVAAMFLQEVLLHPENYPSIRIPKVAGAENLEEDLCQALANIVHDQPWTFAEDCAVRSAVKEFAGSNGGQVYSNALVTLPNKLTISLNQRVDGPLLEARNAWLKDQLAKTAKAP
jgi:hypothetical protein